MRRMQRANNNQEPVRRPTLFANRNICRDVLTRYLTAGDIEAVMKTSWSMREAFKGSSSFKLLKDASVLLQAVMADDIEKFASLLEGFKEEYGDRFWHLLLAQTRGVEERGKRWEAISVVEFALCAGAFSDNPGHGYMLNHLLDLIPLEHRHLAIAQINDILETAPCNTVRCAACYQP